MPRNLMKTMFKREKKKKDQACHPEVFILAFQHLFFLSIEAPIAQMVMHSGLCKIQNFKKSHKNKSQHRYDGYMCCLSLNICFALVLAKVQNRKKSCCQLNCSALSIFRREGEFFRCHCLAEISAFIPVGSSFRH